MPPNRWVLITGEYPPQPGGVSDYTRLVAHGLAEAGDEIHVWAPATQQIRNSKFEIPNLKPEIRNSKLGIRDSPASPAGLRFAPVPNSPIVHEIPGSFGPRDLKILDNFLNRLSKPYRLLVQYVPHAFGCKGMNVPFCWWLSRRPEPVWIMFHEVAFPLSSRQPLAHNVLGVVTRLMAKLVARNAERIFVSIPAWERLLPKSVWKSIIWLPVPSNLPTTVSPTRVAEIRRRIAPNGEVVLGHFGTYAVHVTSLLVPALPSIIRRDPARRVLLLGKGSEGFAASFRKGNPGLGDQVEATGSTPAKEVAAHLAACDCIIQPYADGVCSRRTSLLASLALGLPIVANHGPLTDPVWLNSDAVVLAPSSSSTDLIRAVEGLLAEPQKMKELSLRSAWFYQEHFALAKTIQTLRREARRFKLAS